MARPSAGRSTGGNYPHRDLSVLAAAYEANVPATVHVGIGYDILHQHPNFDGASAGECSYRDFLIFAHLVENLQGGRCCCFGSAVMGPEVYLKALSMSRNVARQQGRSINDFATAVFDIVALPEDLSHTPPMSEPAYYYRPFKTILVRTVADGGKSFYIRGEHRQTLPALYSGAAPASQEQITAEDAEEKTRRRGDTETRRYSFRFLSLCGPCRPRRTCPAPTPAALPFLCFPLRPLR